MAKATRVHSTPRTDSSSSDLQFNSIEDAENFLKSHDFRLVDGTCNWTNDDGDDAGVYSIDGRWGEVKGWRVEINRRDERRPGDSPKPAEGLSRRLMLAGLAVLPMCTSLCPRMIPTSGRKAA